MKTRTPNKSNNQVTIIAFVVFSAIASLALIIVNVVEG